MGLIVIIIVLGLALLLYMIWEARSLQVNKEELRLPNWPKGFDGVKFLFITDIHRRTLPETIKNSIQKEKIDLILIGGDVTEKNVPMRRVRENIRFLSSLAPAYFVWGNHDYQVNYRELDILLREEKVQVLDNRSVSFESGDDCLWLIGVDDVSLKRDNLDLALLDIDKPGYQLLLCHNPDIMKKLEDKPLIRTILCGHTHGGQICLPFIGPVIRLFKPRFTPYYSGKYTLSGFGAREGKQEKLDIPTKTLFISRGVGTTRLPIRLLAPPEINLLTFRSE